ncbi:hypothetical protein [Mesobacillus zeae]|uniref:Uncharacterized protein n=1 Tax=Mesobacillus zeae TaxID=1917180 RepID=A0A398BBA1_9BACI|nr:hypothetical protein D1970_05535 [Mesobacillus zeae]
MSIPELTFKLFTDRLLYLNHLNDTLASYDTYKNRNLRENITSAFIKMGRRMANKLSSNIDGNINKIKSDLGYSDLIVGFLNITKDINIALLFF